VDNQSELELEEEPELWATPPAPAPRLAPWRVDPAADYDALWRKVPKVPDFMVFARAISGYAAQFHGRVPAEFTVRVDQDRIAVSCPCGETPLLRRDVPEECACGRFYCEVGGVVRVAYTGDAVAP
jgi:hypothetical protein